MKSPPLALLLLGCLALSFATVAAQEKPAGLDPAGPAAPTTRSALRQQPRDLIAGQAMAVAYSGFRAGQHPDRGDGAVNPSRAEVTEDLEILHEHGFRLIRLYDSGPNSRMVLDVLAKRKLPMRVLLGIWLDAEVSNHEGCAWLTEPIPEGELAANRRRNAEEVARGIELAKQFEAQVVAVNVGNEALVEWNDHMVPLERVLAYVGEVRDAIEQPVTVAENYRWWADHGAELAAAVDFVGVHTYPVWESKGIEEALAYTISNLEDVSRALPDAKLAVLEAGWASVSVEFGERASEANQQRYYRELEGFAKRSNITVFFFEAFDEPWKGDPNNPLGAEKHWGLWTVEREAKLVVRD